ncbi:MAG TPA: PIN domain-containing protein, partial [Thermoanaerobaculia bacterium]|nr:PIN domain-containing protein [Thermoanaerobaculia bacterium]
MDEPLGSALPVSHALPFPATNGDVLHAAARGTKVFVLDTSVILYDGQSLKNFQEHDVAVPITVLEELDQFKKGNSVMNLQARQFIRQLDTLSGGNLLREWIPLNGATSGRVRVLPDDGQLPEAARVFGSDSNDHRILGAALRLREAEPGRRVILVSKDINLRLKARALNLLAEDYETIKIRDVEKLRRGHAVFEGVEESAIDALHAGAPVAPDAFGIESPTANHYYVLRSAKKSALACYNAESGLLERLHKVAAYGVSPRNAEQTFALHAILNPTVQLVTLSGAAGTG